MAPSVARAQDTIRQDQPEPDQTGRAVLAAINVMGHQDRGRW